MAEWKETTLGSFFTVKTGKRDANFATTDGQYPFFTCSQSVSRCDEYSFDGEALLLAGNGDFSIKRYSGKFDAYQRTYVLLPHDPEDRDFLFYAMKHYLSRITNGSRGSVISFLTKGMIEDFSFLCPDKEERLEIARVLGSLDDKIELLREENKTLEATAQAIFKEWFVNFNFPNSEGRPYKSSGGKMIDSELGEIPEGWRVGTVKDVIKKYSVPYRCDKGDLDSKGTTPIFDQGATGLYGYTSREADFVASKENPVILFTNHTCNMWFVDYPFCAIQNVLPFRGNDDYSTYFVFYMTLGQISFIEYKGHWPDFEHKKYAIPTPGIANKFAEIIKPLQYKIWNNNSEIKTISTLRDTLLLNLMNGEVGIKGFNN